MGRYFQLRDQVFAGRWHVGEVTGPDGSAPRLIAGIPLIDPPPLSAQVTHLGLVLDFSLTSFAVPITTHAVARAVSTTAGADVQSIPVRIAGQTGMQVLNAVRIVRCVDESRSEFLKWTAQDHRADLAGQYRQITKLRLDPRAIPSDAHFFRVADWKVALIVSEAVKDAMDRAGCAGAKFIEATSAG